MKIKVLILAVIFLFLLSLYPVVKFFLPPGREYITSPEIKNFTKQISKNNNYISSCKIYNFQGSLYFDYKLNRSSDSDVEKYIDNIFNVSHDFLISDETLRRLIIPSTSNPKGLRIIMKINHRSDIYTYESNFIRYGNTTKDEFNDNYKTWDFYKNNKLISEFTKETY